MKIVERAEEIVIDYEHPEERDRVIALLDRGKFFILKTKRLYPYVVPLLQGDVCRIVGRKITKKEK